MLTFFFYFFFFKQKTAYEIPLCDWSSDVCSSDLGNPRKKILIPDSAHGTNPATAATVGYAVENLKSNVQGMLDVAALGAQMNEDVAALMLTNPNTLGVFEQEIHKIADILHAKDGLLYMDGANMNALVGKVR